MNTLESYLYWRGDLLFEQDPLNEVDGMILSELSYINYFALSNPMPKSIQEAAKAWAHLGEKELQNKDSIIRKEAYDLLLLCGNSPRFKDLILEDFVYEVSIEDDSQFGAIKYVYKNKDFFIAFQGTDLHVIGWKEDFGLSYLPAIPSQDKAKKYLTRHLKNFQGKLSIGGHSKGGNLAIYSLIFQEKEDQDKVKFVYNYDGPGFNQFILLKSSYERILPKIKSFVPQDSLVGLLLYRLEEEIVVETSSKSLKQHLGYYWKVEKNFFKRGQLSQDAKKLSMVLDKTLEHLDEEQKKHLTDAVFSLFGENAEDNLIIGNRSYNLRKFQQAIYQLSKLPSQSKKLLLDVVVTLIRNRVDLEF